MPEGPSIVILRQDAAKFAGQVVRHVSGNSRQDLQRMHGQRVRAVCSWGKHFLVAFDGFALRVHFMLFGRYRIDEGKVDRNGKPSVPRVSLAFDNGLLNLYACSVRFIEGDLDAHRLQRPPCTDPHGSVLFRGLRDVRPRRGHARGAAGTGRWR
jgi:endonuclease-8